MTYKEGGDEKLPVQREAFALGTVGEIDFQLILAGSVCEAFVSEGKRCGKPTIRVLDFDISSSTEQLPVCGDKCENASRQRIVADLAASGRETTFGINGWGRH